jgi:hypothetical protein
MNHARKPPFALKAELKAKRPLGINASACCQFSLEASGAQT